MVVWAQLSSLVATNILTANVGWHVSPSVLHLPSHHSLTRTQDTSAPCLGQQLLNQEGAISLVPASDLEVWLWCPSCNNRHQNYPARKPETRLCVRSCGPYSRAINTALNYAKIYLNKYFYSRGCLSHNGHFLLVFFMLYWTLPQSERGFVSFHVWVIESGSSNGEYFFTFTNVKHTNGPDWLLFIYLVRFKEGQHLIKTKNIHKLYEVTGKSSNIRVKIQETK